jgi:acylphosphatase
VIARRIVVSGRVQGVFFRDSTRQTAQTRGVSGWVRNTDEGTVEAHLEGDEDAVGSVIRWASSGPRQADVTGVDVDEVEPEGLDGFEVR